MLAIDYELPRELIAQHPPAIREAGCKFLSNPLRSVEAGCNLILSSAQGVRGEARLSACEEGDAGTRTARPPRIAL